MRHLRAERVARQALDVDHGGALLRKRVLQLGSAPLRTCSRTALGTLLAKPQRTAAHARGVVMAKNPRRAPTWRGPEAACIDGVLIKLGASTREVLAIRKDVTRDR